MADKSKPSPPTDVSPGSTLPAGDHYEFSEFGVKHTTVHLQGGASVTAVGSVYASTASAFSATEQQAAVLALKPKLELLDDMVLVAIGHGEEPAGPHLDNPNLPEGTLKPLAANELTRRKGARDNRRWVIGTCFVGPLLLFLGWALNYFTS